MRIIDDVNLKIGLGYDNNADTIGIVFKLPKDTGVADKLGVIIPKFMSGYEYKAGDKATDKSITVKNDKCVNAKGTKSFLSGSMTMKNYVEVRPLLNQNQSMANYVIGDKVLIQIIDNDIKTMAFLPYSINRLGQRDVDVYRVCIPANSETNVALTEDNTYYLLLDSDKQQLVLSTSKKNKESCAQTLEFDSKQGLITLSDNGDRKITLDTKNDEVVMQTSGSSVKMTGDKTVISADSIELNGESSVKIKTDTLTVEADTIKSKGSDVEYEYDNFKQTTQEAKFKIDTENHEGNSVAFKGSTFHVDIPVIGLNGCVVFPSFKIGSIPNINVSVPPTSGMSGPDGSMLLQTDPSATPLAKYPQLMSILTAIAAAADAYPSGGGSASAAVASLGSTMMSTKIMAS